jgi:hypothetical protein
VRSGTGARPDRPPVAPLAVASAGAMIVAVVVAMTSDRHWPGAPHLVALPPLDLTADLRFLLARTASVPVFALGAVASVAGRTLLLAALLARVDRGGLVASGRFVLAVWPLAFAAAALQYAGVAALYLQLFWLGTAVAVVVTLLAGPVPWTADGSVRAGLAASWRRGGRLGTVGASLVMLTALGSLADLGGPIGGVLLVPVSAVLTWLTIATLRSPQRLVVVRRAIAGLGAVAAMVLLVAVAGGPTEPPASDGEVDRRVGSLMLMSGIDSSSGSGAVLELDPRVHGWSCHQVHYFSYAGPGDGQPRGDAVCPIRHGAPYEPPDTVRSRRDVVPWIEQQVAEMEPPKVVVGHSQGAWFLWEAAADGRLDDVDTIVLLGAFPANPVGYSQRRLGDVGRVVIDVIVRVPPPDGATVFDPGSPLGSEWLAAPGSVTSTFARPLPRHLRVLSIASAVDLPAMPHGHRIEGAVDACPVPVVHPDLPYSPEVWEAVTAFVDHGELPPCPWWRTVPGVAFRHMAPPPSR